MGNYPEELVAPMRAEVESAGFTQLNTPKEVENAIIKSKGTVLLFINSVCGCSAGNARPAIFQSLKNDKKPDQLVTVFAGMELEAVAKAREYLVPYPPSSPCIALFKDSKLVHIIQRHEIDGVDINELVSNIKGALNKFC